MPVEIPRSRLDDIGAGGDLELVVRGHLEGPAYRLAAAGRPSLLELDLSGTPTLTWADLVTVPLTSRSTEGTDLSLVLGELKVDGVPIPLEYPVELGSFEVEPEPLTDRIWRGFLDLLPIIITGLGVSAVAYFVRRWWERRHPPARTAAGGKPSR